MAEAKADGRDGGFRGRTFATALLPWGSPTGKTCQLFCEDHVGTYTLPYPCRWSDGTWRNAGTEEPVKTGVVGWRVMNGANNDEGD
jgi:hypothetical protein